MAAGQILESSVVEQCLRAGDALRAEGMTAEEAVSRFAMMVGAKDPYADSLLELPASVWSPDEASELREYQRDGYLAWVRSEYVNEVIEQVGTQPTLCELFSLPVSKFYPIKLGLGGPKLARCGLFSLILAGEGVAGNTLLECARTLFDESPEFIHESWHKLVLTVMAAPVDEDDKICCYDRTRDGLGAEIGFCYTQLFSPADALVQATLLGSWPRIGNVIAAGANQTAVTVSYAGRRQWHVGDGSVTWGELMQAVTDGVEFFGFSAHDLLSHQVGVGTEYTTALNACFSRAKDLKIPIVYVTGTCSLTKQAVHLSKPAVVAVDSSGWVEALFLGQAMVRLPSGKYRLAGRLEDFVVADECLTVWNGCVQICIVEGPSELCVGIMTPAQYDVFLASNGTLPRESSSLRLAMLLAASYVVQVVESDNSGTVFEAGRQVKFKDEPGVRCVEYCTRGNVVVKVKSAHGAAIEVIKGSALFGNQVHGYVGGGKTVFTGSGFMDAIRSLHVDSAREVRFRLYEITDEYEFDDGGPDEDDGLFGCPGEVFQLWHGGGGKAK